MAFAPGSGIPRFRNLLLSIVLIFSIGLIYFWQPPQLHLKYWSGQSSTVVHGGVASVLQDVTQAEQPECADLASISDVFVLVKTGAREARNLLPIHLQTTLRCVPHFAVFSDREDEVEGIHVQDILATLPDAVRASNSEFEVYEFLQKLQAPTESDLDNLFFVPDGVQKEATPGWRLDKWKFFPLLRQAHEHPSASWFVFIETDTNIIWHNLLQWLRRLDSTKPHYLGAQSYIGGNLFAHGGSGFILSRPAIQRAVNALDTEPDHWLSEIAESCCGDLILGKLLSEGADVRLTQSWPIVQGETVYTLDYTEKHWCFPPVTQHHMTADAIHEMWSYEQHWAINQTQLGSYGRPLLHGDIFKHFFETVLSRHEDVVLEGWDNISKDLSISPWTTEADERNDLVRAGYNDADACRKACEAREECVQWSYTVKLCSLGFVVRIGEKGIDDAAGQSSDLVSGWMRDRIEALQERMEPCEARWILRDGDGP